jgi:drug/metabolite transporter (DMT)-like permease
MDLRAIAMGVAFAFMWSSAFASARIIVADAPPLMTLALRFFISGALGIALAAALGQSARLTAAQWRATIVFGICQNALYLGLYFVAMQTIEASVAAIIASSMPLIVAAAGWALLGERLPALGVAGLVAGFAGVVLIMGARLGGGAEVDLTAVALCAIGVCALASATLALRGTTAGGNVLMVVGLQMVVGAVALTPFALLLETPEVRWSGLLIAAFVYTVLVPGLAATLVWFLLVRRIGAVRAASFHFLNPFFGVGVAALVLGETVGPIDALGVAIIMAGILAVQWSRQQAARNG